jgi:hypothetical protein
MHSVTVESDMAKGSFCAKADEDHPVVKRMAQPV